LSLLFNGMSRPNTFDGPNGKCVACLAIMFNFTI
jgi:hypothetical protein